MSLLTFDPHAARIRTAHRRLAAAYARTPGAPVPVVDPNPRVPGPGYSAREVVADLDKMLESAVRWANGLAATDNDWPPFINTYCGVVMVAEAFGCPLCYDGNDTPWTKPVLTDISQVWELTPVPVGTSPLYRRLKEWIDYAQRQLGTDVPFWTMDVQSPFSVAAHILDAQDLLAACITNPAEVHHLCRMITDYSIALMQDHLAQMEHPGFPGRNFPSISERIGICIADDTPLIMLGPAMYREFGIPYNAQVGAAFGGIHIHSCGDYRHNLDNLLATPGVRSIQLHAGDGEFALPETPVEDCAFNRARTRVTCFVDSNHIAAGDAYRGRYLDHYAEYVLPRLRNSDRTGLILQSPGVTRDLPDADAALRWTRARLASPVMHGVG